MPFSICILGANGGLFKFFLSFDANTILKQGLNPPVLVFVQNKERGKELYNELKFGAIRADVIHADLSQIQVMLGKLIRALTAFKMCLKLQCTDDLIAKRLEVKCGH